MNLDVFLVNAFSEKIAEGNPAGVVIYEELMPDDLLQSIAIDIGKSETAFIRKINDGNYAIRWFSPKKEMPICGHATLAAASVISSICKINRLSFVSSSDTFVTEKDEYGNISMNFPLDNYNVIESDNEYLEFFPGISIMECIIGTKTRKVVLRINESDDLELIKPNYELMKKSIGIFSNGIGITKKSKEYDFESRYFNPWAGVNEDPITGSVHTVLSRYWGEILKKDKMIARQSSFRPGNLELLNMRDRVIISGKCKIVISGKIQL